MPYGGPLQAHQKKPLVERDSQRAQKPERAMVRRIDRATATGAFTQRPEDRRREDKSQQCHVERPYVAQRDLGGRERTGGQELLKDNYGIKIAGTTYRASNGRTSACSGCVVTRGPSGVTKTLTSERMPKSSR